MAIKSGQLKEKSDYQALIIEMLRDENGYLVRPSTAFEAGYGMDTELLFNFLEATQKDELTRLEKLYKDKTRQTILSGSAPSLAHPYTAFAPVAQGGGSWFLH